MGQIVNFLILFIILSKLLYKPIVKMLNERREKIAESLQNAKKIEDELAKTEIRTAEIINQAEAKSQKMIEEAATAAGKQKDEILKLAQDQAAMEVEKAKAAILAEKAQASKELEDQVLNLVALATSKILRTQSNPDLQKKALAEALAETEQTK